MCTTSLSPNSDITLNSGKTVADIIAIVNYAIGKMRKQRNLNDSEIQDLQQDGYLAAIGADKSYDPSKSSWSHWVLTRVNGQLRTSIARLRNFGISGADTGHSHQLLNIAISSAERDKDDEDIDDSVDELMSTEIATDEAADTASVVETLLGCVSDRSKHILKLYYGLDGQSRSLTAAQLAKSLGYSKKHAFHLLQVAQDEARACVGVGP